MTPSIAELLEKERQRAVAAEEALETIRQQVASDHFTASQLLMQHINGGPWYCDDLPVFPQTTPADGIFIIEGDMTTIAIMVVRHIRKLRKLLEACHKNGCDLSDVKEGLPAIQEDRIQQWLAAVNLQGYFSEPS